MKLTSLRPLMPLACASLALAGCGSSNSSAGATRTVPTPAISPVTSPVVPTPGPTVVVKGGDTAAIVNGRKIPMTVFRALIALAQRQSAGQPGVTHKALATETMNAVIADELVGQYATAHGLSVGKAEVDAPIKRDEQRFGGVVGLQKKLTPFGLTIDSYKTLVRASIQRHKVAAQVTPLQAAHVRHILIATTRHKPPRTETAARALASQVLAKITHGGNFGALAKQYSDDTGSGRLGGDLGTFCPGLGRMVPEFDVASSSLPPHHPTIVHTQFGYHIIDVLSRGNAQPGQCAPAPGSPAGTPAPQPEQTRAFQSWILTQIKHAKIQRIAQVV